MRRGLNLKAFLADKLEPKELKSLYKSYDIIGDIAVIRVPETIKRKRDIIAEAVIQTHKHVKTVLCQFGPVSGDFRLRNLEWVAGERKTQTINREHGCVFKVDLERCYFSPRLSHERMRIAQQVQPGEVVVNMFAGVGCFSIILAKHSEAERIYSVDLNRVAIHYMHENILLNRVEGTVVAVQGDARKAIEGNLREIADRVLIPLPEKAYEYLDCALLALKPAGGWVHYYDFEHARKDEDPIGKTRDKVTKRLQGMEIRFEVPFGRIVRGTGPRWYQTVIDIRILP
jgi:tRNA (guanine37-N1)-methyltransferase